MFVKKLKEIIRLLKSILIHPLNKKNKFKAIFRFLTFNIARRLINKKEIIFPWIDNAKFIIGINEIQLRWNVYWGMVEYKDMSFLLHCLRKDDVLIDCGANIGAYTILASKVIGAKSIAFEPHPETVKRFIDQISVNRINNSVTIIQKAVGNKIGKINFTNVIGTGSVLNKVKIEKSDTENETINVDVTTLDHQLKNIDKNYIIKIDIEGYEYAAVQGAKSLLMNNNLIALIIENNQMSEHYNISRIQMHEKLTSYNLFPVEYKPSERKIIKINFEESKNLNLIYVRDFEKIQKLCLTSKKFRIHTANGIEI